MVMLIFWLVVFILSLARLLWMIKCNIVRNVYYVIAFMLISFWMSVFHVLELLNVI